MNILDYIDEVKAIQKKNSCTWDVAVSYFITNLRVMRDHYIGKGELNYHTLGQIWNKLSNEDRLNQLNALLKQEKPSRSRIEE